MQPHDLLTPDQIANMFDITERTVLDYLRAGKIKCNKLGHKWLIPYQSIVDYLTGKHDNNNAMQAADIESEVTKCQSLKGTATGISTSLRPTESEYATLLKLPTNAKRKNTTTA
jgi:excisionase family DNA binding protein